MHIMEIVSGTKLNGAVIHCLQLSRELARQGHEITIVCRPCSWIWNKAQGESFRVMESELNRRPRELRRIASIAHEAGVDVLHTHSSRANFFGVLLRWMSGIPCVATAHSRHFQLHWMFNDRVIANSDATRRYHQRVNWVRASKIETIHCFVDPGRFEHASAETRREIRHDWGAGPDDLLFGIVGNVEVRKGHWHLIRALPRILSQVPHARLVIVGNGPDEDGHPQTVQAEAERLGVSENIIWSGYRSDVPRIMHALDLCVVASLEEPFGLTATEAMAAGTPVVATAVGGLPENVAHGETGLLVRPGSPHALAESITELLLDGERRARFGRAGRERVRKLFSPDGQVKRTLDALASAINARPRAA